jgi:GNAT superfamily N-acetyltransferase
VTGIGLRPATVHDADFLGAMLAEAVSWDRPYGQPAPPLHELLQIPRVADYIEGWGRDGDGGMVAECGGAPVGACWFRRFCAEHPGYGFLGDDVPEIGLAVLTDYRGTGIGTLLLAATIDLARGQGIVALGLSVARGNAQARRLYERTGFAADASEGDSLTMRLWLGPS